jgi:predicted ATPase
MLLNARCHLSSVLMIVEDLHWMDSASEVLFARMIDATGQLPLMVVHTRRPEYRPPWFDRPQVSRLLLEPLSADETGPFAAPAAPC